MAAKSAATRRFEELSKQRIDFTPLPGGGQRARLTITLAGSSRPFTFVEDIDPRDVATYEGQISGIEVVGRIGAAADPRFAAVAAQMKGMFSGSGKSPLMAKLTSGGIGSAAKKIATSKVMQTAASGLAMIAPALGPMAPIALGVSGGIGVAGKLLGAKNAAAAGAPLAALQITQSAISDAQRLSPNAYGSLLQIAGDKANSVQQLVGGAAQLAGSALRPAPRPAPRPAAMPLRRPAAAPAFAAGDAMQLVAAGRVQSDQAGPVTPAQLQAARLGGRLFFVRG